MTQNILTPKMHADIEARLEEMAPQLVLIEQFTAGVQSMRDLLAADDAFRLAAGAPGGDGIMTEPPEAGLMLPLNPPLVGTRVEKIIADQLYPHKGTMTDKILYAITSEDRFLHSSQIRKFMQARGSHFTRKSFSFRISKMFTAGMMMRVKYNNASNMIAYGLPHMVNDTGDGFAHPKSKYRPNGKPFERADKHLGRFKSNGTQMRLAS